MNKLTAYWRRKRQAVQSFIKSNPVDPAGHTAVLKAWMNRLTVAPAAGQKSLEDTLEAALDDLEAKRAVVTYGPDGNDPTKRRSARLVRMVQGVVGASPEGSGYYSGVGLLTPGDAHGIAQYHSAVETTSVAAANFLHAAKNTDFGGPGAIFSALDQLIRANPEANEVTLDELKALRAAIDASLPRGGAGDGSAYWPSIFISSSTSIYTGKGTPP